MAKLDQIVSPYLSFMYVFYSNDTMNLDYFNPKKIEKVADKR
jgi:hypothetical protein